MGGEINILHHSLSSVEQIHSSRQLDLFIEFARTPTGEIGVYQWYCNKPWAANFVNISPK